MTNQQNPSFDRFEELAVTMVTEGLDDSGQRELERTDWSSLGYDPQQEIDQLERAAAAFAIAFNQSAQASMPPDLRKKILSSATASSVTQTPQPSATTVPVQLADKRTVESALAPPSWREGLALLATAACLAFMIFNWEAFVNSGRPTAQIEPPLTIRQKLANLEKTAPDLVNVAWTPTTDKDASGRVVWSDAKQEGYMEFKDLDANQPGKVYQLWIFEDPKQRFPIDGGVFKIEEAADTLIAINAKIPVGKAVQFAVTVEDDPGVVVSEREIIPVLAEVPSDDTL